MLCEKSMGDEIKAHAIMVEFLFQGHINPFINLAIGLASKGCKVTYVQTEFTYHRMLKANVEQSGNSDLFSGARESGLDIHHTTISDGFPLDFDRDVNFLKFYESIVLDFPARVEELIGKIVESSPGKMKPFIVADAAYLWPAAVAAKYSIMYVSFWTPPALRLLIGHHLELLKENAVLSSYDDFEEHKQEIAGVKLSNVRDFIKHWPPENDPSFPAIIRESIIKAHLEVRKADFILYNTIQELESEAISALNQTLQTTTYAIGPTNFLAKLNTVHIPTISSLRTETDCTEWLDSKPPGSVLFVSFGSIVPIDKHVVHELAHGLLLSHANFLWVLRTASMVGEESASILPPGFQDDIGGRGLVIPWCNQCDVLSNPAVGGFLTHCGWSSVLESIWYGVPMICHPFNMDQPTNRNMVVDDWKIGINLCDGQRISRDEVAEKVESLMSGTQLEAFIRIEMKKVNKIVHNALDKNGSSDGNLDKFLNDFNEKMRTRIS